MTSHGGTDIGIAKFSGATGATLWAKLWGGSGWDYPYGLAVDRSGDIVVTGNFAGGDLGGGSLSTSGLYVAKYSGVDGSARWVKTPGAGTGYGITTDPNTGYVIVTGNSAGTTDFGGGAIAPTAVGCIFLAGYDGGGNYLWAVGYGSGTDTGSAVAVDANGYVALTGKAISPLYFGPGSQSMYGNGNANYFVANFTISGTSPPAYRWAKRSVGSNNVSAGNGVTFDTLGHVVIAGTVQGTADLGGATASGPLASGAAFGIQYAK
jgi:hypothetical protein